MIIDNVKINGFGKIENKNIEFRDGINIIYGENEAGKSTILKCISSMLYGISKTKNGKNISDFDKYKPWSGSDFSGKIKYTLDDGKQYEIFREFKKKNSAIYNKFGEDISNEFSANKSKEMDFLEQQIGVDENLFLNTAIIQQQSVKLEKTDTNNIVQKISNLVSTGNDNISFKKSMDKLNKMQNDSVGTERTKQKPINIVEDNIKELSDNKRKLNLYKENVSDNLEKRDELKNELEESQTKKDFLKDIRKCLEEEKIKNIELEAQKDLVRDYLEEIEEIQDELQEKQSSTHNSKRRNKVNIYKVLLILFVIIAFIVFVSVKKLAIKLISIVPIIIVMAIMLKRKNVERNISQNIKSELEKDYEIAIKTYNKKKQDVENKEKNIQIEIKNAKKEIVDKYNKKLNIKYVEEKVQLNDREIEAEIELVDKMINQINLQSHMLEVEKESTDEKLEELVRIDEKLEEQINIRDELMSLNTSFCIAKECLEKAYDEIKHNISPRFEENLCNIIFDITDGKYKNISVNDEVGLRVEVESGEYMPVDRLSVGTIDEMYLALRLSTLSEVTTENLPIILDETFAYFDNNRLKNIMRYLQDQNYNNQIIIFTCSNREENALNELKIEYNLINLEK